MKKALMILSVLVALPLSQTLSSAQAVSSFEALSHIGFGYNAVKTSDFNPSASGEFFVNIASLKVYPVEAFGIEIGVDYKTVDFTSKEDAFYLDNKIVKAMPFKEKFPNIDSSKKSFSRFRTNTFSAPVTLNIAAGSVKIGGGAEANYNLPGRVKDKYFVDGKKNKDIDKGAQFNKFNYNFLGYLIYDDTGIYVRYYPKSSRLMPEGGVDVSYFTIGVVYTM
ncbi:MAG: hypothetical protein J5374_08660 [Bacteroidales bacterium]|nr:hypothetical protein [Bacteroidales bacterium]